MALAVKATPTLEGKEADDFLRQLEEGENREQGLVATPKLEQAVKLVGQLYGSDSSEEHSPEK